MKKFKITKALFLSILVSGVLAIRPVKSEDNTAKDYEQAIEEIDTILGQSNTLRDKYGILKARLEILGNDPKIRSNDFDRIYISLYKNIEDTVKAIKSEVSEEASSSIFNSESSNLDNRICAESNIECSSIIRKLIEEIQPEINYIIKTTNELREPDKPQAISSLEQEDKKLVQNPKLEEFRSLVGEQLEPEAQTWVNAYKKLIEESKELIEKPKELINDEQVEEKENKVPKYNALLIRFENIETNLVKINSELSKELGRLADGGDPKDNKDILYIVISNLALLAIFGGLLAWYFIRKSPQLSRNITESHSRELSNNFEQIKSIIKEFKDSVKDSVINNRQTLESNIVYLIERNKESSTIELQKISHKIEDISRASEVEEHEEELKVNDIDKEKENQKAAQEQQEEEHKVGILDLFENPENLETLVNDYNQNPKHFVSNFTKNRISSTSENIGVKRSGKKPTIVFQEIKNGIYFIVDKPLLKKNYYLLVPKDDLVINDKQYNTVKEVFECDNYENRSSQKFKLVQPAIVEALSNNEWQLVKDGEGKLEFG